MLKDLGFHLVFAFIGNSVHSVIIAFPLWWALNRLGKYVGINVGYFDAFAICLTVWIIACAWAGVKTEAKAS